MSRSESQGVAIIVICKSDFHMIAKDRKESQLTLLSSNFKPKILIKKMRLSPETVESLSQGVAKVVNSGFYQSQWIATNRSESQR